MPTARKHTLIARLAALILLGSLLAACSIGSPANPSPTGSTSGDGTAAPTAIASPIIPTETPQPVPAVILLVPADADTALAESLRTAVGELAPGSNLTWEERATLSPEEITPEVKVVVVAGEANAADLAVSAPQTRFVMVGAPPAAPLENLTAITPNATHEAFLAGFIGAIATEEWRAGMITRSGGSGTAYQDAFRNGAYYLCGLCTPKYPPYAGYPVTAEAATPADVPAALQALSAEGVQTVFVDPSLAAPETWTAVAATPLKLITAGGVVIPDELSSRRVAAVQADAAAALRSLWPDLLAGTSPASVSAAVVTTHNPDLLSTGRMRLVDDAAAGLQDGSILPDVVPLQ